MSYTKTNWEALPSTNTPIIPANLNKIEDELEALDKNVTYSTTEQKIGTWEDEEGIIKPLYRKTLYLEPPTGRTDKTYSHGISNIRNICDYTASMIRTGILYKLPYADSGYIANIYNVSNSQIILKNTESWTNYILKITIYYTKSTD